MMQTTIDKIKYYLVLQIYNELKDYQKADLLTLLSELAKYYKANLGRLRVKPNQKQAIISFFKNDLGYIETIQNLYNSIL